MCGIAGYWGGVHIDAAIAERMALQIAARGPDDCGVWVDKNVGLALAHRRLSILDLSPAGHQPMRSSCGRYVLVYNGEVYNHLDLRADLTGAGFRWRGHSDTETLLAAVCHWGLKRALQRVNGMFALALWDASERTLFLARDRMGEKPLYYGRSGDTLLFASELKALVCHPAWVGEVDRDALTLYMRHNYIPAPWSIYQGIAKLPPAHFVAIRERGRLGIGEPQSYWDLAAVAESGAQASHAEPEALADELDALLRDSVRRRMVADVPLGAFLSGGYDSTVVVAFMQAQTGRAVQTFTIGFQEQNYNEAKHAKAVAAYLGTQHTELYVTPKEAMTVVPNLPNIHDEPFSDSSQIPTFLVSELARRHVKAALSGDGGDELFCGYNRYVLGYQVWQRLRVLPPIIRRALAGAIARVPARPLDVLQRVVPQRLRVSNLADRLLKLADVLVCADGEAFYRNLVSHAKDPGRFVIGAQEPNTILGQADRLPKLSDLRERMMYLDMMTYLPDDILTKTDRASMAVSLEARLPLLDHRLVEFAWRVPTEYKHREGRGKWLLRQVLYRYVPKELVDRPKMGFGVPIEHWLRGPLRGWAEELLGERRLREEGFLNPAPIRRMWSEHVLGVRRWHYQLWDVLMFQAWLECHG